MTTVDEAEGIGRIVSIKGAPEVVLDKCVCMIGSDGIKPLTNVDRKAIHRSQMHGDACSGSGTSAEAHG